MPTTDTIARIALEHEYRDAGFQAGMKAAADAANAAATAGEKVAGATAKVETEVRRAIPAWQTINQLTDANAKVTAVTERENRRLEARLEALRLQAAKNAEVAATAAERERILIARRDAAIAKAEQQAAAERARWDGVAAGADKAAGGVRNLGTVAASAGLQLQDVVVQAQMGTSAFTILAQQGSQFASVFGPTGAMVGAAIAVGAVAASFIGLTGEVKSLDDALKESGANFDRLTEAADARAKGLSDEAEAVNKLRNEYAAMGETAARAERIVLQRQTNQLGTRQSDLVQGLGGGLARALDRRETGETLLDPASGLSMGITSGQGVTLARDLDLAATAYAALRGQQQLTVAALREYIAALDDAAKAGGGNRQEIERQRDAAAEAMPKVVELEKAWKQNAIQAAALRLAAGESVGSILAAGNAAATAGGQLRGFGADAAHAAVMLHNLRLAAAQNPTGDAQQTIRNLEAQLQALRTGGKDALESLQRTQEGTAEVARRTEARVQQNIKDRIALHGDAARAADEAESMRSGIEATIRREVTLRGQVASETTRMADAERDAAKAARERVRDARAAAREQEQYERTHYDPAIMRDGLLSLGANDDKMIQAARRRAAEVGRIIRDADKSVADAARDAARERERTANAATDNVVRYAGDAFADMFRDTGKSWSDMWRGFLGTARATLTRIAAEALLRPIIQPLVMSLVGSGGTAGASAGGSAGVMLGSLGNLVGLDTGSAPGGMLSNLGSLSSTYSAGSKIVNGMGMFAPGGLANTGFGRVDSFLNTPIGAELGPGVVGEGFNTVPQYTMGNAVGAGLSIAGGAYGLYSGLRRGGVGGYTTAVGGGIGVAAGAASAAAGAGLIGASSTLAMLGPYGMIAAAVLMAIGSLLPGAKPSNMTGSAGLQLETGALDVFGQTGKKFSQENRDQAASMVRNVGGIAQQISQLLGGAQMRGRAVVDVGNRDGLGFKFQTPEYETPTFDFERTDEGLKQLNTTAIVAMLDAVMPTLNGTLQKLIVQMPRASAEGMLEALAKFASVTGGGRPSQAQQIAADKIDFTNIDAAVSELRWVRDVYEPLVSTAAAASAFEKSLLALRAEWAATIDHAQRLGLESGELARKMAQAEADLFEARRMAASTAVRSLDARLLAAQGNDGPARLLQFDVEADRQRDAWKRQLSEWGLAAEEQAREIVRLETVLGAERLDVVRDMGAEERRLAEGRAGTAAAMVRSIADYASGLRTRQDSPLSATEQYFGASADFNRTVSAAMGGDADALGRLTRASDTFLAASRSVYGSGEGFARDWQRVVAALGGVGERTPDQLTATVLQSEVRTQTQILSDELVRLRAEVAGLRTEQRLANAAPRAAA